jgi:hypothetical protein
MTLQEISRSKRLRHFIAKPSNRGGKIAIDALSQTSRGLVKGSRASCPELVCTNLGKYMFVADYGSARYFFKNKPVGSKMVLFGLSGRKSTLEKTSDGFIRWSGPVSCGTAKPYCKTRMLAFVQKKL